MSKANEVAIIMGSDSDWKIMKQAKEMLGRFEVGALAQVVSAHRTPGDLEGFAKKAEADGIKIIIAGAGGAAHLPGMIAAFTTIPVIGVPINATVLNGMDALLSIVQMPTGIPVATVAIENAGNAALLALRILGVSNPNISKQLKSYREELAVASRKKTKNLK